MQRIKGFYHRDNEYIGCVGIYGFEARRRDQCTMAFAFNMERIDGGPMFPLNIQNGVISFKDIKTKDLPQILQWYNKVDDFKFATGIDKPITLEVLKQKYIEVAICSSEFFVGIYILNGEKMIGILKGNIKYKSKDAVWISSIVIDPAYQGQGYGTMSIGLLLGHLQEYRKVKSVYLSVIEDNLQGKNFWDRLEFVEVRRIEKHLELQNKQQGIIIMHKSLEPLKSWSNREHKDRPVGYQ